MSVIRFGTDGWRAIIAREFTFDHVRSVAQAFSEFIKEACQSLSGIAVSYDTRFMSDQFARSVAEVIASNQIPVLLSRQFTPTPVLSYAVKHFQLNAGLMITASHNPYHYNGIKFKSEYGGPVPVSMTQNIEKRLWIHNQQVNEKYINHYLQHVDFFEGYQKHLNHYINIDRIRFFRGKIVIDPMHGAGCGYLGALIGQFGLKPIAIHDTPDVTFGGLQPEPIFPHLNELAQSVISNRAAVGLAVDGDADRFGVIDGNGQFVQIHDLLPILFEYLIKSRGWKGHVVRTSSMADTIDQMAEQYHRSVWEVPVGFKNVAEKMLTEDTLIGGEESGGYGFRGHVLERDGILAGLYFLDFMLRTGKKPSELLEHLYRQVGPHYYRRIDTEFPEKERPAIIKRLPASLLTCSRTYIWLYLYPAL